MPGHIRADGSGRDTQSKLQLQLVRDALLAPRRIVASHLADQGLELLGNPWSSWPRSLAPDQPEALSIPTD